MHYPRRRGRARSIQWLSYRCFTAKDVERVPLFGEFGLLNQLGSVDYAWPRKFRERFSLLSSPSERFCKAAGDRFSASSMGISSTP